MVYTQPILKRITLPVAQELLETFLLFHTIPLTVSYQKVLLLAKKHHLSVYDATYVYLAKKTHKPLLTLDKKLGK